MKHDFYTTDKYGFEEIDTWRLNYGFHNGPECRRCGAMECEHCRPEFLTEECPSGQLDIFEHGGIT